jgi:hypothetical protein
MGKEATSIPWDPDCTSFPSRKNLPSIPGAPEDAAWVWGVDDNVGRLNLLTPTRVKAAASQIQTGEMARLDLPLNVPLQPAFGRQKFEHTIKPIVDGVAYDDIYHMNTQSGTQWDGFRHVGHVATKTFYNGGKSTDFYGEGVTDNHKCSIHHWSTHGFSGRAILLDYRAYAAANGIKYDTATSYAISLSELKKCGESQGLNILPASQGGDVQIGDIFLIRTGWTEDYYANTPEKRAELALRGHDGHAGEARWVGVEQSEEMKDWLHDCYFSAVGGDQPAFERWPTPEKYLLHEYLLALWGMPLGEMLDLEKAAEICRRLGRWTFFFTSAPANCPGGVSSHCNATGIW